MSDMNKVIYIVVSLFLLANFATISSAQEQPELGNWELYSGICHDSLTIDMHSLCEQVRTKLAPTKGLG